MMASCIVDGAENIAGSLSCLINNSLEESIFPKSEKVDKILPIYKSGNQQIMDNYRPISTLPVLSKVIEKVVHGQLITYVEKNGLFTNNQFGFRRGSPTEHVITCFTDYVRKNMDYSRIAGAVFIDLRKAFDTVDQCVLAF